ncbi:hypothetical protein HK415_07380 [Ramlibacter sp. B156]|uniref:ABC3 transporter permease C-terminal domain-containing protein n=1 Tax=Ramlibacter montanisoli TaxID=2732512 RepID=A0A849KFR1_9BURK|nr:hypothetical protein [Ramlibacter montanisoli]
MAATAVLGTLTAIAATVRLSPAEAMRPPAPGSYRQALLERIPRLRLDPALRMILRNIERRPLRSALTVGGIAASVAIVIMGNFFRDAIDAIVDSQFNLGMRSDVIVWMTDQVDAAAGRELARLPGVMEVETGRRLAVRFIHGARSEKGLIDGHAAVARLQRVIDAQRQPALAPADGLLMTDRLAEKLGLKPGDRVTVELREGKRGFVEMRVQATVSDMMGLNAFMQRDALNRALGDGDVANFFSLRVSGSDLPRVLEATQGLPRVAGAFSKATMLRNMQEISARNVRIMSTILTLFAAVIAVGVVYNNARIALAERTWELASLRVLGFTRTEVSVLLLGRAGHRHRGGPAAGHVPRLGADAFGGGADALRPVRLSGGDPAAHLCLGRHLRGRRRRRQRAGGAPAHRPPRHGRGPQDTGVKQCSARNTCCWA